MGICQVIWICYTALSLGCYLTKHGEPHTDTYNFWTAAIACAIQSTLLYFGGFFG